MKPKSPGGKTVHGGSKLHRAAYYRWCGIRNRCNNPNNRDYHLYGGRGIKVCERWESFVNFLADVGDSRKGLSLDRIDNNGPYSPENCRWATPAEQTKNRRVSKFVEFNGESHLITEWSVITGMHVHTLRDRLKNGWPVETALTKRPRPWGR